MSMMVWSHVTSRKCAQRAHGKNTVPHLQNKRLCAYAYQAFYLSTNCRQSNNGRDPRTTRPSRCCRHTSGQISSLLLLALLEEAAPASPSLLFPDQFTPAVCGNGASAAEGTAGVSAPFDLPFVKSRQPVSQPPCRKLSNTSANDAGFAAISINLDRDATDSQLLLLGIMAPSIMTRVISLRQTVRNVELTINGHTYANFFFRLLSLHVRSAVTF